MPAIQPSTHAKNAERLVGRKCSFNTSRKVASANGRICSVGTKRNYTQCVKTYLEWREVNELPVGEQDNRSQLQSYIHECAELYVQSSLDQIRGALQVTFGLTLPRVQSDLDSLLSTRSYSNANVATIVCRQREKNALATMIAHQSGLRAHELITLRRHDELSHSPSRNWDPRRFAGMTSFEVYVVTGKGGLRREVAVPKPLAIELERRRRPAPKRIEDREIFYDSVYDVGVGQAFSQSFSSASNAALGYSTGAHGLRHSYVKNRFSTLVKLGFSFLDAQCVVSQEVGHFRPNITLAYFR